VNTQKLIDDAADMERQIRDHDAETASAQAAAGNRGAIVRVPSGELLEVPEVDGRSYSPGSLMVAVLTGELALPVWVRCGNARHKITAENRHDVCRGLLIAISLPTSASESQGTSNVEISHAEDKL